MNGRLTKNHNKTEHKHPDWKGSAVLFGDTWEVGCWIRDTSDGRKCMSLKGQLGRGSEHVWHASLFKNSKKSAECSWDYKGTIRGREDIVIYGTNVKTASGWVCELRFEGDVPLIPKDRDVNDDGGDVPF